MVYLAGRGAAQFVASAAGVAITLGVGVLLLGLRLDAARVDYPLAAVGLVLGALNAIALGVAVAAVSLCVARHSWSMAESVAAGFHILCGAIFPLEVLPGPLQAAGLALPLTYWLELMRRALAGAHQHATRAAVHRPGAAGAAGFDRGAARPDPCALPPVRVDRPRSRADR